MPWKIASLLRTFIIYCLHHTLYTGFRKVWWRGNNTMKYILSTCTCRFDFRQMLCFFIVSGSLNRIVCLVSIHQFKKIFIWNLVENCHKHLSLNLHLQVMDNFVTTSNHNCNKIISSKWLAGALSSALMGQCDRTVWSFQCKIAQYMSRPSPHTFFTLSKKPWGYLVCV